MAERDRYRDDPYDRGRPHERGFTDRARDEVRSWFGDDDAARRRQMDESDRGSSDWRDRGPHTHSYAAPERWGGSDAAEWREPPDRWSVDGGRAEFNRTPSAGSRFEPSRGYAAGARAASAFGGPRAAETSREGRGYYEDDSGHVYSFTHERGRSFAGKGPKGYRRSDERIREDVCDRLAEDSRVDASDIEVMVNQGEVTLSGIVQTRDEKRRSEDLVENVSGVLDVQNNLRVTRSADRATPGSDSPGTVGGTQRR